MNIRPTSKHGIVSIMLWRRVADYNFQHILEANFTPSVKNADDGKKGWLLQIDYNSEHTLKSTLTNFKKLKLEDLL